MTTKAASKTPTTKTASKARAPRAKKQVEFSEAGGSVEDVRSIRLQNGQNVRVLPLKTRQVLKLVKIFTNSLSPEIIFQLDQTDNKQEQLGGLIALLLLSIPEAEDESIAFLRSMIEPDDEAELEKLDEYFFNPKLNDVLSIFEVLLKTERETIPAVAKQVMSVLPKVA